MNGKRDILDEERLHNDPFMVPEGYLEGLSLKAAQIAREQGACRPTIARRVAPYVAIAASFAAIVAIGSAVLKNVHFGSSEIDQDALFAEYLVPVTEPESVYYLAMNDSEELTEEEIVEYLIESGATLEEINEQEQN